MKNIEEQGAKRGSLVENLKMCDALSDVEGVGGITGINGVGADGQIIVMPQPA